MEPDVDTELKQQMQRTYDALKKRWEREGRDAETVYQIDIPAQKIEIVGASRARDALDTLRCLKVCGTYRVSGRGAGKTVVRPEGA